MNGHSMELRLQKDKDSIVSVLDSIRDAGIDVIDIHVEEDKLEDVFVQLTGTRDEQEA